MIETHTLYIYIHISYMYIYMYTYINYIRIYHIYIYICKIQFLNYLGVFCRCQKRPGTYPRQVAAQQANHCLAYLGLFWSWGRCVYQAANANHHVPSLVLFCKYRNIIRNLVNSCHNNPPFSPQVSPPPWKKKKRSNPQLEVQSLSSYDLRASSFSRPWNPLHPRSLVGPVESFWVFAWKMVNLSIVMLVY